MAVLRGWCDSIVVCNNCGAFPMLIYDVEPWSIWHPWDDGAEHMLVDPRQGTLAKGRYEGSVKFVPAPSFVTGFVTIASRSAEHATALTTLWIGQQLPITMGDTDLMFAENPADLWGRSSHKAFRGGYLGFSIDQSNPIGLMAQTALGTPEQIRGIGAWAPNITAELQAIPNVGSSFGGKTRPGYLFRGYLDDGVLPDIGAKFYIVGRHGTFNPRDAWLNMASVRRFCRVTSEGPTGITGYIWKAGEYMALAIDEWGTWSTSNAFRIFDDGTSEAIP